MRVLTFRRTVVPVSAIVLGLAALSAPPLAMRSVLLLLVIAVISFSVLAVTRWWRGSHDARPLTRTASALKIATDDASDLVRMGSDAG